eukprot:TRINITY_DN4867_c0_g1_i1.p1 TRINITY_DN4867_c0_g1~~TRINITY_DN4867_c0_g1_i1.p1  ORF type:complete len:390 (+),score=33.65 TRINITY_DN4867_c0_g1_i1:67-1236(+)
MSWRVHTVAGILVWLCSADSFRKRTEYGKEVAVDKSNSTIYLREFEDAPLVVVSAKETHLVPRESSFLKKIDKFIVGLFVVCCCAFPLAHVGVGRNNKSTNGIVIFQSSAMFLWLIGAMYLFTSVIKFNSPHFGSEQRHLSMIESIYLLAQIITTVGYGDITPASLDGKMTVGIWSAISVLLVADIVFTALDLASTRAKSYGPLLAYTDGSERSTLRKPLPKLGVKRLGLSVLMVICCMSAGVLFAARSQFDRMNLIDGVYWSFITLSSIGFGDLTPYSEDGMLFSAFWMIIGSAAMVNMGTKFFELMCQWRQFYAYSTLQAQTSFCTRLNKHADADDTVDRIDLLRCSLEQLGIASEEHLSVIIAELESLKVNAAGRVAVADAMEVIG